MESSSMAPWLANGVRRVHCLNFYHRKQRSDSNISEAALDLPVPIAANKPPAHKEKMPPWGVSTC